MKAFAHFNVSKDKYELKTECGQILTRSKSLAHIKYLVETKGNVKVVAAGITEVVVITRDPSESQGIVVMNEQNEQLPKMPEFTINEKFEFMNELTDMVIRRQANSILITGRGGVGKTHSVLERLQAANVQNIQDLIPQFDITSNAFALEDDEDELEEKAELKMDSMIPANEGFVVVKGKSTPKALYRILFENRKRIIKFDDCDSILENNDCANLLKAATDNYEDRWISWRSESPFADDSLPQSFKFEGAIIIISNKKLSEIDEAFKSRNYKVDLSMNNAQRIERMEAVLEKVMPEVDMGMKMDSLQVLKDNMDFTSDINFRSLMGVIKVRVADSPNWERLARYTLLSN